MAPALSSFLRVKKITVNPPSFKIYRVEIASLSLRIATQSHLTQPLPDAGDVPKMVVSIPGPILECAFPTLVQQFTGRVLPSTTAQPEPVRFLLTQAVVEILSDVLQILSPLVPSTQQDAMHIEPLPVATSNPNFIDLTLSD